MRKLYYPFGYNNRNVSRLLVSPVLFGYNADAVMAVSHHDDPAVYKNYVVNSATVVHTFPNEHCTAKNCIFSP